MNSKTRRLFGKVCSKHTPVRAFLATLTFSFDPERADVRPVSLIVWRRPRQLQQQITRSVRLAQCSCSYCAVCVCQLHNEQQYMQLIQQE